MIEVTGRKNPNATDFFIVVDAFDVAVINDTTTPTVGMTSPASGATVNGTISVTANASDNVGVAGVQFQFDGANLGAEDTTAPYSVSWDTTTASNGSHSLTAIARDAAGNRSTSTAVTVTVSNVRPPTITSFTPASGVVGTSVTTSGTNFTGATAVRFNGVSASFTVNSATTIQATVPGGGDERADQRDDTGRHGHQYQQLHCEQSAHDHQFHAGDGTCRRQCQHHRYRL